MCSKAEKGKAAGKKAGNAADKEESDKGGRITRRLGRQKPPGPFPHCADTLSKLSETESRWQIAPEEVDRMRDLQPEDRPQR